MDGGFTVENGMRIISWDTITGDVVFVYRGKRYFIKGGNREQANRVASQSLP